MRKNTVNWKHGLGDRFRRVAALWCVCCLLFSCLPLPSRSDVEIQEEVSPSKQMSELLQMPETELKEEIPETQELAREIEESVEAEEATVLQAVNAPVQVSITYYADAGLPETTELVVREEAETEAAPAEELAPLRKTAAKSLKTMNASPALKRTAAADTHVLNQEDITETADVSLTEWQAGQEAPEIPLYHRTLDISLVAEGEEIEPNPEASILVTVVLPDLKEGLEVEVRHETAAGSVLLESTTEGQQVTFVTDSFSLFDFSAAARQITSWTTDLLENAFYGIGNSAEIRHNSITAESPIEGLSVLEAFSTTQGNNLWLMMQRVKDIALGKLESITLYAVEDGKLAGIIKENIGITDVLRFNLGNYSSFALVRDSGLRRRIEEIGSVVLSGLMPKNGTAEATDVTEEYANFVPSRSVEQGEADETSIEQGETVGTENGEAVSDTHTIAAYDISITNDGEEYQPEENPVTVSIQDAAIATAVANGNAITLWHVLDDGTTEQITDFTVDGDTVTFDASGFSVYVITETTVEKIMTAADGNVYRITVTYDGSAQIPEGAELVVNEVGEGEYLSSAAAALGIDEDYLLYRKFLDISFKTTDENGEERIIEPATPVKVQIELLDVEVGADKLQVVHFGEDGAEKVSSTSSADAVITFTSNEFSVFGFGNVLEPLATAETDEASIELLGFGAETELTATDAPEVEEGLEVLGAYNVSETDKVWIKAELKEDVELSSMESVAIYSVMDSTGEDETAGKSVEELTTTGTITELTSTEFAVIKDTGYRHLSFSITPDEEDEEKTVTLDGMMPKAAVAAAVDVTEQFSDHDFTESAPIDNEKISSVDDEETTPVDEEPAQINEETLPVDDDTSEDQPESSGEDHTTSRIILAAFDISITAGDQDYQPDETHPVTVTITDDRILSGDHNLELWHIRDDGTEEKVEEFTVVNGEVEFTATGFSTYAIVYNITTYYQSADGETYKITVEYGDDAELPEGIELRVSEVDEESYLSDAATALETEESHILYRKFLDISFVAIDENGEEKVVEPHAAVKVSIELQDVTAGANKLQVVHFGDEGAERLTSTANDAAVVTFETGSFSVFGIGNVLTPLATAETDEASIEILGFSGEAELASTDAPTVEEGLEVLGMYNLSSEAEKVWIKADVKDGVELSSMESVVIYTIGGENNTANDEAGKTAEEMSDEPADEQGSDTGEEKSSEAVEQAEVQSTTQITELTTAGTVAELNVSKFALVKDTGYRHLSFEIKVVSSDTTAEDEEENTEETGEETGKIILDGMMPKMATAAAVDVTEAYADHEYFVPEEETTEETSTEEESSEEQPVSNDAGEDAGEPAVEETQDEVEETQDAAEETHDNVAEEQKRITLAAFNITISNIDSEYQPDAEHPISVEIRDSRIVAEENIELWHIRDDRTEERVEEFTVEDGKVEFTAIGFSVYTIVEAPVLPDQEYGWIEVTDFTKIAAEGGRGFYLDTDFYYLSGGEAKEINGVSTRHGINALKTQFTEEGVPEDAELYYFIVVDSGNGKFKILDGSENKYIQMKAVNKDQAGLWLEDSIEDATVFSLESVDNRFYISAIVKDGTTDRTYYWNRNTKPANNTSAIGYGAIAGYSNKQDGNTAKIRMCYYAGDFPNDPYELNGKTYSIVYHEESVKAAGLTTTVSTSSGNGLAATELLVRPDVLYNSGELLIAKDIDLVEWTFESISGAEYYVTTIIGGNKHYLTLNGKDNLTLEASPSDKSKITIAAGTDDYSGMYNFSVGGYSLTHTGNTSGNQWFTSSNNGGKKSWMHLAARSSILTDEDFTVYSAEKVDLSDRKVVPGYPDPTTVVIYTRKWNENTKKYEFYVLNADGSVMRAYESGDMIQWVGSNVSTAEWDFTEYHYEGTTDPNYYYELQNTYSGQYIAPQMTEEQILSNSTIGINLNGRRYGYYYSTILAWDDTYYSYVGLRLKDDYSGIEYCSMNDAEHFYFAIMKPMNYADNLETVSTVDNVTYGITMKMVDISKRSDMSNFLGSDAGGVGQNLDKGLLSTKLVNGYPTVVKGSSAGASLSSLYSGEIDVNHLFIENTYYSSGYYEFDSTQNTASFYYYDENGDRQYDGNNFTVYSQLASYDSGGNKNSLKHGQFFPYNYITKGTYASDNGQNLYDALGNELPDSDPRKAEDLFLLQGENGIDPYFAMELSASFTQTVSGLDAWGHDIIYEFTGDDDFWLYVDDELIIDLGGIHSAVAGSVNYKTGEVYVNGTWTTIHDIFIENRRARGESIDVSEIFEQQFSADGVTPLKDSHNNDIYRFRDYTQHTMRIFYMERGAGASNLHMRFNLASVKPGTVELSKVISGVDDTESFMADYPFQIFFMSSEDNATEQQLIPSNNDGISVQYKDTTRDVTYHPIFTASDGTTTYNHVFMLKPGEIAIIDFPDDTYSYRVVECFLNTEVYDHVYANNKEIIREPILDANNDEIAGRGDFDSGYAAVSDREKLTFDNNVNANAKGTLTFTKHLYDETGTNRITHDNAGGVTFTFRLYLGTENDTTLPLANMHSYHVKDENGNYCIWDSNVGFVSLNETVFANLSDANKVAATFITSMNGSIDKIPVDYTVEVREIPAGTKYKVEERYRELPDGYSLLKYLVEKYVYNSETDTYQYVWEETDNGGKDVPEGIISAVNPNDLEIDNMKGWGIRVQKTWSDAEWMQDRDPIYFALYEKHNDGSYTMVNGSVTCLNYGEESIYWFIQTLDDVNGDNSKNEVDFMLYEPHEVLISNSHPTVDSETGIVSNPGTVTRLDINDSYQIHGTQIGETNAAEYTYAIIDYNKGNLESGSNVRIDTITNKRAGIELYKMAWDGTTPLAGAVFTLTYMDEGIKKNAGAETYTSDSNGYITTAYLREDIEYTLTEIASPHGYQGIQTALTISRSGNAINVSNIKTIDWTREADSSDSKIYYGKLDGNIWWTSDDTDVTQNTGNSNSVDIRIGQVIIRNKPYTLQFKKTKETVNGDPLDDVIFALYPQAIDSTTGQPRRDYLPVDGFDSLETGINGIVPDITVAFANGTLDPGTYYLHEVSTPAIYRPLSSDVKFTVSDTGVITLDSVPSGVILSTTDGETAIDSLITIPNALAGTVQYLYVNKEVIGTEWKDTHTFTFTAKLYLPDGLTPWSYTNLTANEEGQIPFINGTASFSLTDYDETAKNMVLLEVPQGAVVKVTEDATTAYDTTAVLNDYYDDRHSDSKETFSYNDNNRTSTVTINDGIAVLMTYKNTRKYVNVSVKKNLSDPLTKNGNFAFTGMLTDNGVDITDKITNLSSFELTVNNNSPQTTFKLPVGSVLTITESPTTDQIACYNTTYSSTSGTINMNQKAQINVLNTTTINVTNTRKTQKITVNKTLDDSEASGKVDFIFKTTLYNLDGTTLVYNCNMGGATTGKNNSSTPGYATFTLSPTHGKTVKKQFTAVPYGAKLVIEEQPYSGGDKTYTTTVDEAAGSSKTIDGVIADQTINFVNTLVVGTVNLSITKTVTGDLADQTVSFPFAVSGLTEGDTCNYTYYVSTDGETWTEKTGEGATGVFTVNSNGSITGINLAHHEKIVITLPAGSTVTISETNGDYAASYVIGGASRISGNMASNIIMDADKTIDFANELIAVAPTGINTRHTPYLLLLLFGLMLLIGGGVVVKKRRGDDPDEGEVAVRPALLNTGPLGRDNRPVARGREPVNTGQPTHSTQNAEDHIRWRNSVWVENNGPQRGFAPLQARASRGSCPQEKGSISCPQAKLWMTRTGPTRKRGDAG